MPVPAAPSFLRIFALLAFLTTACAQEKTPSVTPPRSEFPILLWDVNFNEDTEGLPPRSMRKEEIEARESLPVWKRFPQHFYNDLVWTTPTRRAVVESSAFGLNEKPVVFACEDSAQPHYGPQIVFSLPREVAAVGKRYLLQLDIAKNNEAQLGGFTMGDVGEVMFREDGSVIANGREIAKYSPSVPLHFEVTVDTEARTVTFKANSRVCDMPWIRPRGSFTVLFLQGLLPGGYAQAPGKIAFDNIQLALLEIQ